MSYATTQQSGASHIIKNTSHSSWKARLQAPSENVCSHYSLSYKEIQPV